LEIAFQNGHRSARCNTGGLPGERGFSRSDRSDFNFFELINTSDQDVLRRRVESTQYTSVAFGERCKKMGVRPSMGTVGDAYDNAMAESFFATLECELIDRRSWQTKTEARLALFTYIEGWYNPRRRHSALGQISPAKFERSHQDKPRTKPSSLKHDLPTVGDCVACATPPVDKSAPEFIDQT
jgi:putative transposase